MDSFCKNKEEFNEPKCDKQCWWCQIQESKE